jgi:hypothetical protein
VANASLAILAGRVGRVYAVVRERSGQQRRWGPSSVPTAQTHGDRLGQHDQDAMAVKARIPAHQCHTPFPLLSRQCVKVHAVPFLLRRVSLTTPRCHLGHLQFAADASPTDF